MDDKTKAKYKLQRDKGIMSCPYCGNDDGFHPLTQERVGGLEVHPIKMASDESYATRYILCNPDKGGCGKGWTEYWNMTDVEVVCEI